MGGTPSTPIPTSAPVTSAPISSAPITSAPVSSAPVVTTASPVTGAPVPAPVTVTGAPVSASPVAAPQIHAGTSAPTYYPATRINAGGGSYEDSAGNMWTADDYFLGGTAYNAGLDMTDGLLYTTERYFNMWVHPQPFLYDIPVPAAGNYATVLHFAETFFQSPGKRVFDVWVEGNLFLEALDIYAEVGYKMPLILSVTSTVNDGFLTVEFVPQVENPKLSALEVMDARQFQAPTSAPTVSFAPSAARTTLSPTTSPAPTAAPAWSNIYINCGGPEYLSNDGLVTWQADNYFTGGSVYVDGTNDITPTADDVLFQSERHGTFTYEIPVAVGNYEITVLLAELYHQNPGGRKFKLTIEDVEFNDVDIVELGGGVPYKSVSLEAVAIVSDGFVTIAVEDSVPKVDQGKISGIEIKLVGPHLAHSVAKGPYRAVDIDDSGTATFLVDGSPSHTHAVGKVLSDFKWKLGADIIGTSLKQNLTLPVGEHIIALTVTDDAGNENTEATTVTILPFGYPAVTGITPLSGSITGGDIVTITGAGFTYGTTDTVVHFGLIKLTGSDITIVDSNTITVNAPPTVVGAPVAVSVETPLEISNSVSFNYIASVPINFDSSLLFAVDAPTVAKFGPDRKLYIGTIQGYLHRVSLNDDFSAIGDEIVSFPVAQYRCILGIAFDPMDTKEIPDVYVASSYFFHGSPTSSSGESVNGNIKKVSGPDLDEIVDVITGLPISDHDHGLTDIEFGSNGEIYFGIGSNTNGGKPGQLTGSQLQKEGYYSAAIIKADISNPDFDGHITYDAEDDGSPNGGTGISVFAMGLRNPYGIAMHSNGELYGTDNGPNLGYGDMLTGCGPNDFVADKEEEDKVLHIKQGKYYGHPNPKRAAHDNDPRQCVWRSQLEPSDAVYTSPLVNVKSSTDGIVEYTADHFDGQLRGNLILSVYQGPLYRLILTPNGEDVIPQSNPAILLVNEDSSPVGFDGLDVCQAPNGNLVEVRVSSNAIYVHKPNEPASSVLTVKSVFPLSGGVGGGYILDIYGINFPESPTVTVQGMSCPVVSATPTKIECTVPAGSLGSSDVMVANGGISSTFKKGFRYITGARE